MNTELLSMSPVERYESRAEAAAFSSQGNSPSSNRLSQAVRDRYRCPENLLDFTLSGTLSRDAGYFRFGKNAIGYGRCSYGRPEPLVESGLHDALREIGVKEGVLSLPFDPTEVIDNLRLEHYSHRLHTGYKRLLKRIYYGLRPFTNRYVRKQIQKFHARNWRQCSFPQWPLDTSVENICETLLLHSLKAKGIDRVPFVWFWPNGARGCAVMTHDVETEAGRSFCPELMDLDDSFGIKASFQIVPEKRYAVTTKFLDAIRNRGFEVGIQDLNHDGRLYDNRGEFLRRAAAINRYATEYGAKGFRAAVLYRDPEWFDSFTFSFDMSIPNVAHLDPQRGGCCTVMPYFIGDILELPVTTTQDYTLFHVLKERSIDLWKLQTELILGKSGLASFIVHPDYVMTDDTKSVYKDLLGYLRDLREKTQVWCALPSDVDAWWRARSRMSVTKEGNSWRIVGEGADRAVLAHAKNVDGRLVYELEEAVGSV
jgi:hypothetical protein